MRDQPKHDVVAGGDSNVTGEDSLEGGSKGNWKNLLGSKGDGGLGESGGSSMDVGDRGD